MVHRIWRHDRSDEIGTGNRTGDLLALQWDVLDPTARTVTIRRTIATDRDSLLRAGLHQERGRLPRAGAPRRDRRHADTPGRGVLLRVRVPSSFGTFRHPNHYRTSWRTALLGTSWQGVTPKRFRKTVATVLRDELGIDAARDQLGHEESKTTQRSYADEVHRGPAAALVLSKLLA